MGKQVYFKELKSLQRDIKELVIIFNREDKLKKAILAYYSRLIEGIEAIINLIKKNKCESAISVLVRNVTECSIDISNLDKQVGYLYYLSYLSEENKLRIDKKSDYYKLLKAKNPDLDKRIEECETVRDSAKKYLEELNNDVYFKDKKGKKEIIKSVAFKFRLADRKGWYDSFYVLFSNDIHNNLSSIEQKYMKDIFSIKVLQHLSNDFIERTSFTLLVILIEIVPIILKISEYDNNEELEDKIESIKNKLYSDKINNKLTFTI